MTSESEMLVLRGRLAALEARLDFVYRHLGIEFAENAEALESRVAALLQEGKLIEAIKTYREIYNVGLAEAKQAVDAMQSRLKGRR